MPEHPLTDCTDIQRTVKEVIEWLSNFPPDCIVYAYEGEICGIVVTIDKTHQAYIMTKEG